MGSRRDLILTAASLAAGVGLTRGAAAVAAEAAPRVLLRPVDPAAIEIAYVENATRVDPAKNPTWRRGQSCANCTLIDLGTGRMRGCSLLPGRLVMSTGWCRKWKARGA
jgi:hypothetical protein